MSDRGSVTVSGEVLDVTTRTGTNAETGKGWSFTIVSVLAGKTVQEVRWEQTTEGGLPTEGSHVSIEVSLSTYKGRIQCNAVRYSRPAAVAKSA